VKNILLIIVFCLPLSCAAAGAQQVSLPPVRLSDFDNYKPPFCADRSATIDVIHQKTPPDTMIVVIARLGRDETRPELNRRRLHNVRAYWTEYLAQEYRRNPKTIGLVEGDRVEGYGRLEFYVEGKLVGVIKARRDADVDFGDCYPPDDSFIRKRVYNPCWVKSHSIFYPCRDRYMKRRNGRS
jgi:hypothetical protein